MRSLAAVILVMLCLASCSAPGGGGSTTNGLATASSVNFASYVVLDLDAKTIELRASLPDLLTSSVYKTSKMAFRRVPSHVATLGAVDNEALAVSDEKARYGSYRVNEFLIGVFEVTREQWSRLSGSTPWTGLTAVVPDPGAGVGIPAYNLSADAVVQALTTFGSGPGWSLRMPTGNEWEAACRAGGSTLFTWGDQISGEKPDAQAVFLGATTFAAVGSKDPNGLGLYDMHGNAWELVDDGGDIHVRGGSWLDPIVQARCANQAPLPYASTHPLVGVRLVIDQ
jgi:formylglycine-generating enzyme required for sulfatase activity